MKSAALAILGLFLVTVSAGSWAEEKKSPEKKAPTVKKVNKVKKVDPTGGGTNVHKKRKPKKKKTKERFPLGGYVIFSQSLGLGTFTAYDIARRYEMSLSLRPRYYFLGTAQAYIQARLDMSAEITSTASTSDVKKRQVLLSDTILTFRWNSFYTIPVALIKFDGYMDLLFPSSLASQYTDKYLGLRFGFYIKRGWAFKHGQRIDLAYGFRFSKNFHKYSFSNLTAGEKTIPTSSLRVDEGLANSALINGGNNVSFDIMNRLTFTYTFLKDFYVMVDLLVINGWTYSGHPKDALSSNFSTGGRGQRDTLYGTLEFGYQILKWLAVDIGVTTAQPPKTADGKSFRFPFFDFRSSPNNYTTYYLDIVASF